MPRKPKSKSYMALQRALSKKQARETRKIARSVFAGETETKTVGTYEENQQLYHNKPFYVGKLLACNQGVKDPDDETSSDARIGDEISLTNINVRLWLSNKLDRPNCMYKCALFWYDEGTSLSDAVVYFTQKNKMLDRYNNESITIIDQQIVFSTNNYAVDANNHEHSYLCTLGKRYKGRKITYDEGTPVVKKRNIGMVVVVYDAFGTLQTDNIASFSYNHIFQFKDA